MALASEKIYTIEDIYNLPEGQRAELIDGQIYMMAPPNRQHQEIVVSWFATILWMASGETGRDGRPKSNGPNLTDRPGPRQRVISNGA